MAGKKTVKLGYELLEPNCGTDDHLSPLIFLHGLTSSKEVAWKDIPQKICNKTKRKAYNLDCRNHGESEWGDEFDLDLNAEDVLNFVKEKNLPKSVIIGHSLGGITAIKAALKAPECFEMVIIEEMFVKIPPQNLMDETLIYMSLWREMEKHIPPELKKEEADLFITDYIRRMTRPGSHPPSDHRNRVSYAIKKDPSGRYFFTADLELVVEKMKDVKSIMAENEGIYDGPSYFLYGTKSPYAVDKEEDHIRKHFPKAILIPFETNKHCIHRQFPDLFVDAVAKCLNRSENNGDAGEEFKKFEEAVANRY